MRKQNFDCEELVDKLPIIIDLFDSKKEAIEFAKKCRSLDDFWTLYHVAQFSVFLEKIEETYQTMHEHNRMLIDIDRVLMVASIIELLNSSEEFVRFDKWCKLKPNIGELEKRGISLWHDYNKIHGSAQKFRNFFTNYLNEDEKIGLMRSVQFLKKEDREFFPLFCYKGVQCNVKHSYCTFDNDKLQCPAYTSSKTLNKGMKECANFLYTLRSRFIHEAKLFLLPKPLPNGVGGSSHLIDYLKEYEFITKRIKFEGIVKFELFSDQLVNILKKYLKQLIQAYLKNREKAYEREEA
jgi:hypothetical protein